MIDFIANFLERFHLTEGLEGKLSVLGELFSQIGIDEAFFVSTTEICRKKVLPILNFEEDSIRDLPLGGEGLSKETASFKGKVFEVFHVANGEREYGLLYYAPPITENRDVLRIIKEVVICGIKSCELRENFVKKSNQLEIFKRLSERLSTFYNLEELFRILTEEITLALNAKGTVIRLVNKESGLLEVRAEYGLENVHIRRHGIEKGDGVSGEVWEKGISKLVLPDTEESQKLLKSKLNISSLICVPLIFEREVIGTISVYESIGERLFSEEDKSFLEALATLVALVIAYTTTLEREKGLLVKLQKHLKNYMLITEINKVLMEPRKLDNLLYILLTTLTFGEEIGFNRGVVFMFNPNTGMLHGMMGVGCETVEETYMVWQRLPKEESAVNWVSRLKDEEPINDTTFSRKVREIRFFVEQVPTVAEALKTGKVCVQKNGDDLLTQLFKAPEYAIVPLIGKENILGVLYVDNRFTGKPIGEDYITLLETFASQASIAIENAKLYSELREMNEMLRTAKEELLVKERLAAVGEMLTSLAHEVRNPLTAIGGLAKLIEKRLDNENLRELAQKIVAQAERLNKMFNDFLYLAKTNTYKVGTADIAKVINESINNLSFLFQNKVRVRVEISEGISTISIDESMLGVVLDNLLKNAAQAMPKGGEITVKVYPDNGYVNIVVEDEGHGIPKDVLPYIFAPFYTTKFNGIGVGLSICYKIVKQHNGLIYAENREDKNGARFVIKLPQDKDNKEA